MIKKYGDKSILKYSKKFDKIKINQNDIRLDTSKIKSEIKVDP